MCFTVNARPFVFKSLAFYKTFSKSCELMFLNNNSSIFFYEGGLKYLFALPSNCQNNKGQVKEGRSICRKHLKYNDATFLCILHDSRPTFFWKDNLINWFFETMQVATINCFIELLWWFKSYLLYLAFSHHCAIFSPFKSLVLALPLSTSLLSWDIVNDPSMLLPAGLSSLYKYGP